MEGLDILYNKKLCYGHDHLNFQENILRDITPFGSHIKRKPGITPKSIKFLSRCKEMLKQSERGLIELLSEKQKNVVYSIETHIESILHVNFLAESMTEKNRLQKAIEKTKQM